MPAGSLKPRRPHAARAAVDVRADRPSGDQHALAGGGRAQLERRGTGHAARPGTGGGGVGAARIDRPAAVHLEVVEEGAAVGRLEPDGPVGAVGDAHQIQHRLLVAPRLAADELVGRVVAAVAGDAAGRGIHLEGEREDALRAVEPVDLVAVGDVQAARLHRGVAVGGGHVPAQLHEGAVVERGHVARHVLVGVAVRPQHLLAGGVEGDVRADALPPTDDPAEHEVTHRPSFRGRPRPWGRDTCRCWGCRRNRRSSPRRSRSCG